LASGCSVGTSGSLSRRCLSSQGIRGRTDISNPSTEILHELDHAGDIERILVTNAAIVSLIRLSFGDLGNCRWNMVPMMVAAFLPTMRVALVLSVSVFHRMGIRV
jgi:hypothetical protein